MYPDDLRYSREHEWVRLDGGTATIGITEYAANELGDIVFVELPSVGTQLKQFAAFGVIESVKAVSDLYAPVSGSVAEVNEGLAQHPELVNSDPYGEGWICRVELSAADEVDALLDATAYGEHTAAG
ncbi:MAG: glycine cleavage system protein GcvH [Chloroflexota bacterium]|nr:glycine cleavage system protein GcvH [Chloroflexota bacterium]